MSRSEGGAGHTVLLLHGQPGDGDTWAPVVDRLEGFRVLAPDRPGYGRSGEPARGFSDNAAELAALLESGGMAPATVVGHSWGGGIAIVLAARYPELVLAGSVGTPDSINGLDRALAVGGIGHVLTVAGLLGIGQVFPWMRRRSRVVPRRYRAGFESALPDRRSSARWRDAWGRDLRTFMTEQRALVDELGSLTTMLGSVRVPTTVLTGEWDIVVPPGSARTLARSIDDAELVVLRRVGHFIPRDAPDALADAVRRTSTAPGG